MLLSAAGLFTLDDLIRDGRAARDWFLIAGGSAIAVFVAIVLVLTRHTEPIRAPERTGAKSMPEPEPEASSEARRDGPYRSRLGRAAHILVPPVSGTSVALVVGMSMAVTAALLPVALHQPRWVEAQAVFGAWWLVLSLSFAVLLYRGWRIADDYDRSPNWTGPAPAGIFAELATTSAGCAPELAMVALVLGIAAVGTWLLVDLIAPALLFAVYYLLVKAMARVANDRHGCDNKAGRALLWGVAWATLYIAPLVVLTWIVHSVVAPPS